MINIGNKKLTKILSLMLAIVMLIGMVPITYVFAEDEEVKLGTVAPLISGGDINVTTTNGTTLAEFSGVTLQFYPADAELQRTQDGYWVGINVVAPDGYSESATYQRCISRAADTWNAAESFVENSEKPGEISFWGCITEQYVHDALLKDDKTINYTWRFDWDADGNYEQKVQIKVDATNITLVKDGVQTWPVTGATVTAISNGIQVDSTNPTFVVASLSEKVTTNCEPADDGLGRPEGGWLGVFVEAPAYNPEKATYQSKSGDSWGEAKKFDEHKDVPGTTEDGKVTGAKIGLWSLVNEKHLNDFTNSGKNFNYTWHFDWNGDGQYDQIVRVSIDPSKVTYVKDGIQLFPALAEVKPLAGNLNVEGSSTGSVKVTNNDKMTLQYSAADTEIGRDAGWYVGIDVIAPADCDASKVKYQIDGADNWEDRNYQDNNDGNGITLWGRLTPDFIRTFKEQGRKLNYKWRFDWNGDGEYEQTIHIEIDPTKDITLEKIDRPGNFAFEDTDTGKKVWVGKDYSNTAKWSENPDAEFEYSIIEGEKYASIDSKTGLIKFNTNENVGEGKSIVYRATLKGDDLYKDVVMEFAFTAVKEKVEGFEITQPSAITYGHKEENKNVNIFTNTAIDPTNNGKIEYFLAEGQPTDVVEVNKDNGEVTIKKAGTVVIEARRLEDNIYVETIASYTLTINKADQTGVKFVKDTTSIDYSKEGYTIEGNFDVTGGQVNNGLDYKIISGEDFAEIKDGKILTKKAGTFVLQVTQKGDDCYNDAVIEKEITVIRVERKTFGFEKADSNVTYNDNGNKFENVAAATEEGDNATITYSIVTTKNSPEETDAASIDAATGVVSIDKAGTVTVTAVMPQDDCYLESKVSYTLTIAKDEQPFHFLDGQTVVANGAEVAKIYGIKEYTITVEKDSEFFGTGDYTYEVGQNKIGATIEGNVIKFGDSEEKVGKAVVTVKKAADECYEEAIATFTIVLSYLQAPATAFTVEPDNKNADGWYKEDVKLVAPEGYEISYSNKLSTNDWSQAVICDYESNVKIPKIYLREKATGSITDAIEFTDYKMDKTAPWGTDIEYKADFWHKIGETLFGFKSETVTVTLRAEDNKLSGLAYAQYSLDGGATWSQETIDFEKDNKIDHKVSFEIDSQYRDSVVFRVYDKAGNCSATYSKLNDEGNPIVMVVDKTNPDLTVEYSQPALKYTDTVNNIMYYDDTATVTFTLNAENIDLAAIDVISVTNVKTGEEVREKTDWSSDADGKIHTVSKTFEEEGDYVVSIAYKDRLDRYLTVTSNEIHVDRTAPVIHAIEYNPEVSQDEDGVQKTIKSRNYYKVDQTAKIVVTDHNFSADRVKLMVTATDVNGRDAGRFTYYTDSLSGTKYITTYYDYANDDANWSHDGDVHTLDFSKLVFSQEANYSFTLEVEDLASRKASEDEEITIDKAAPVDLKITYQKPDILETIVQTLTFNFFKPNTEVLLTSFDRISGIDYFTVTVSAVGEETATNIDIPQEKLIIYKDGTIKEGQENGFFESISIVATDKIGTIGLKFEIPANFKGDIIIDGVTDNSNNTSEPCEDNVILIVDDNAPEVEINYSKSEKGSVVYYNDKNTEKVDSFEDAHHAFYKGDVTATITVTEDNFFEGETNTGKPNVHNFGLVVVMEDNEGNKHLTEYIPDELSEVKFSENIEADYQESVVQTWSKVGGNKYSMEINLVEDGDYTFYVDYIDHSGNAATFETDDKNEDEESKLTEGKYTSKTITIDNTVPEINVEYSAVKATSVQYYIEEHTNVTEEQGGFKTADRAFYNGTAQAKITVTEENFFEGQNGIHTMKIVVTKKDNEDNEPKTEYKPTGINLEENAEDKYFTWTAKGNDTYEVILPLEDDGDYTIEVEYIDIAGNNAEITADDIESETKGKYVSKVITVDKIAPKVEVKYSLINEKDNVVSFVKGESEQKVEKFADADSAYYNGNVKATITVTEENFFEGNSAMGNSEYIHNFGILVKAISNDNKETKTEYLPSKDFEATAKMFSADEYKKIDWNVQKVKDEEGKEKTTDTYVAEIILDNNADYEITVKYTDIATNKAEITADDYSEEFDGEYTSKQITVDKIRPNVSVSYTLADGGDYYQKDSAERKYFKVPVSNKIQIIEHNFDPSRVTVEIVDVDSKGEDLSYECPALDWIEVEGLSDTHEAIIDFDVEANYTFKVAFEDLATNKAQYLDVKNNATDEYVPDLFTYDKTIPGNFRVEYSTHVFEEILEDLTFGYYNAKMRVDIYADDDVAGVEEFIYNYLNIDNVSSVNASLDKPQSITKDSNNEGDIDLKFEQLEGTNTFHAYFEIPKMVLKNDNQFNGTVEFTAVDKSNNENSKAFTDKVIVVDSIAPTINVTYNDPVQNVDDVSYYAGDINATIVINEANFFSEDVKITVTREGATYPVNVTWVDNSLDIHTATFTIADDGDYIVNVEYTDRSGNKMTSYTSNQLTKDTKDPVIAVTNMKHQSANNQETISFSVSITDFNIPTSNVRPTLTAVVKKEGEDGNYTYETVTIPLGLSSTQTNAAGETVHVYTINNLTLDGYYSFSCTAQDYANHSVSAINVANDAGGTTNVNTVNYSVNREGSVFWIETIHTDKYSENKQPIYNELFGKYANDTVTVKLHEVNVDKVDENADAKTVFTLNDGSSAEDVTLVEKVNDVGNYEKNRSVGAGGWYQTTYTLTNEDNFTHDGVYSLNIITYDKANNSNINSDSEKGTISFTLDRTNPKISANVKNDDIIDETEYWVEFDITETNLSPETVAVSLVDRNGNKVESKLEDLGNSKYRFKVRNAFKYTADITAKDLAGNTADICKIEDFTVSSNWLVRFYANTVVFWSVIGGTLLLAAAVAFLIIYKKKKPAAK